jgi:hypothetical protein
MQKLKLFGLFAALTVVLVACPPEPTPVTPPPPPPSPTTPPAPPSPTTPPVPPTLPPSTFTIQGTVENYTRGAHKLKFQVYSPTYAQTVITEGQLAADGTFQITLPDESKLTDMLKLFDDGRCTGLSITKGLQTTTGGSLSAYSSGPNSTGYLVQGTQTQSYIGNPPPGTTYTYYIYADRDASVTGTCQTLTYDMTFKKGWNQIAAVYGQNGARATSSVPTGLKWYYVPTGGIVNVIAPTTKLEIGKSYTFTATAQDSDGQPLTGAFTWNSSDPTNMPVTADGVVTPKGFTANVTISAYLNGANGAIQNVQSYGLQIAGGTYNTGSASLGTAFFMRYVDETGLAPTTDRSFNVTGPGGWNGGAGLSVTYPANAGSAWVARGDVAPVTGNYAFTTATAPAVSSLRAQSLGAAIQSLTPSRSSIMSFSPIPFTPGKVMASSAAIVVTGTGFAIDTTQSLGQVTNITIGDYSSNYTTSSVTGNWTAPSVGPNVGASTFEAQIVDPSTTQVINKKQSGYYPSVSIDALSLDVAKSYEWRVLAFNTDTVNVSNYNFPAQFNVSRASKTFDFKPIITGLSFGGATTLGGPELMITGKNFVNGATIKFGTTSVTSKTAAPPNSINVIVPAHGSGVVDVAVTTPAGTSVTNTATKFEYTTVTEQALNAVPILTAGPDSNLWFAETGGSSYPGVTTVGKIASDGTPTRYPITTTANSTAYITDLSAGPNNTVWFAEGNYGKRIGKINTDGSGLTWYALDDSNSGAAALTTGSDGKIWFLENGGTRIGRIDANGLNLKWFQLALGGAGTFSNLYDIKLGPDANVWFSAPGGRIGTITPAGVASVFTGFSNTYSFSPTGITSGPNNLIWFTNGSGLCCGGSGLGNVDESGTITAVSLSANPSVSVATGQRLASDSSGNLWFGSNTYQGTGGAPVVLGRYKPGGFYTPIVVGTITSSCCSPAISDIVFVGGRVWYARQDKTVGFVTP